MQHVRAPERRTVAAGVEGSPTVAFLRRLEAEAYRSLDGEAYRELAQGPGYRLAIVATPRGTRAPRYTLIVLVDSPNRVGPRGRIRRGGFAAVEAALAARGYISARLDNGWMAHERGLPRSRLAAEWRFLRELFASQGLRTEGRA